ncbi:MAG TPA: hypothetical protein VFX58_19175 [Chitinophagaceae bacterium]|nr:hypothetical protein [Chitinophagaceae bacterium]
MLLSKQGYVKQDAAVMGSIPIRVYDPVAQRLEHGTLAQVRFLLRLVIG